jgi:general secretion pathway protein D
MRTQTTIACALLGVSLVGAAPAPPVKNDVSASLRFEKTQLELVLNVFGELTGRSIIRPANLPQVVFDFKPQGPMTEKDAVEAIQALLAANELGIVPLGDKFAQVLPAAQLEKDPPPFLPAATSADLKEAKEYVSHIVHLEYAEPSEVENALRSFSRVGGNSIIALDTSKKLLIRDYSVNVKRMLEIIDQIDVETPTEEEFAIIDIKYALAADVAAVISNLTSTPTSFNTSTSQRLTGSGGSQGGFGGGRTGFGSSGSSSRMSPRTTGRPSSSSSRSSSSRSSSSPSRSSSSSSRPSSSSSRPSSSRSSSSAPAKPLLGNTRVMPYEPKNAVLVIAEDKTKMALVRQFIDEIDKLVPMVMIEAIIMDIALDDNLSFGVSLAQDKNSIVNGELESAFGSMHGGGVFTDKATSIASLGSGLNYWSFLSSGNWEVAIQALKTDTRVNILSHPRIQTVHAEEAQLFIGETHPYIASSTIDVNGGSRSNYQQKQIGIDLRVLPFVNPDGLVVMDIQQSIGDIISNKQIDGNDVPITTDRSANAKIYVRDGDSVVLGGFIKTKKTESKSGVPILKDIPLLGALFRENTDNNERQELVVLMRPTVLETPEAVGAGTESMYNNMPLVGRARLEARSQEIKYQKLHEEEKRKAEKMEVEKLRAPGSVNPKLFKGLDELEKNQNN